MRIERKIAFILLFSYMCNATELVQLFKLPVLIEHYNEHKENDNKLSFLDYLVLHYSDENSDHDHNDNDGHKEKLPFKTADFSINLSVIYAAQHEISVVNKPLEAVNYSAGLYYYNYFLPYQIQTDIWQPPKKA